MNNEDCSYYLKVILDVPGGENSAQLRFYGCQLEYQTEYLSAH